MYLIDSDVALRLRTARTIPADGPLASWAAGAPRQSLFLSALSLLELERAALQAERKAKGGAADWRSWIDGQLLPAFEGRLLALDGPVAARAARMNYPNIRDALAAATALQHNLTLVTARPGAFRSGKVKVLDPWNYSPESQLDTDWREATKGSSLWLKTLFVRG